MFQKVPIGKHYYNWLLSSQFTGLGSRYYTSSIHFLVVCMLATIVLYSNTCCCCMCTITYFLGGRIKIWIEEGGKHHCSYFIHIPSSLLQFFVLLLKNIYLDASWLAPTIMMLCTHIIQQPPPPYGKYIPHKRYSLKTSQHPPRPVVLICKELCGADLNGWCIHCTSWTKLLLCISTETLHLSISLRCCCCTRRLR